MKAAISVFSGLRRGNRGRLPGSYRVLVDQVVCHSRHTEVWLVTTVTIRKHGKSVGVSLPAETRTRLGLEVGQELTLVELADGLKLVKRNRMLEQQLDAARQVLREEADVLQELAKR